MISGFIEVIQGDENLSFSFKKKDPAQVATWVDELTGWTLGEPQEHQYAPDACLGVWTAEGESDLDTAQVVVWVDDGKP